MSLALPSGWEQSPVSGTGGMALAGGLAASSPSDNARLVTGLARDAEQVRRVVGRAAARGARPRSVRLGAIEARRWSDVEPSRGATATLFVAYTSRGPLVAICRHGPCSPVLRTLRLTGPRPTLTLPPAPAALPIVVPGPPRATS